MNLRCLWLAGLLLAPTSFAADEAPAVDEASAAEADATTAEAPPPPRAVPPSRSEAQARDLQGRLPSREQRLLVTDDPASLGLWRPSEGDTTHGLLILLPDDGAHADWPRVIGPLRRAFPATGWQTLSLMLPDPLDPLALLPPRPAPSPPPAAAPEGEAQADEATPAETPAATEETLDGTAGEPAADDAAPTEPVTAAPTAEELQQALTTRIEARLAGALALADERAVLLGQGTGAYWALRYLVERQPDKVRAVLLVDPREPPLAEPSLEALLGRTELPLLDAYPADRSSAQEAARLRRLAAQGNRRYTQLRLEGLPLPPAEHDRRLHRRLRGWLEKTL